jgi:hypothetical protein
VIFKDDDIGKDTQNLKKWIDIVIKNNAKAAIGLIGKYMKNKELVKFLNTIDPKKIEIFCHGYSHSHLPFILKEVWKENRILPVEFDRSKKSHNSSLSKYRLAESKFLKVKAITFGPPGNVWNQNIIEPLLKNDFKMIFSWNNVNHGLFTVPLSDNLKQNSFNDFIKDYEKKKEHKIYTLQFHHANLSEKQFNLISDVIDFLKNKEDRMFILPSELINISKNDKEILKLISP